MTEAAALPTNPYAELLLRINPTRCKRFFRCEYDWYCYAVLGIEPLRRSSTEAQERGKAMHALLEHAFREYARCGSVFAFEGKEGWLAARAIFQKLHEREGTEIDEDLANDLLAAARWHIPRLNLTRWEVLDVNGKPAVELDLRGSVGVEGVQLQGIIDLALRDKQTGKVWQIDWKTTAASIDTSAESPYVENDYQLLIGRELLRQHGVNVDISTLIRFRSMAPRPPELTSKGKVSVNKAKLACDWETFRQTLVDNREDPDSERALKVKEHLKTATFVQWRPDITLAAADAYLLRELTRTAAHMLALSKGEVEPRRHLRSEGMWSQGGNCKKCRYEGWCTASLRNGGRNDLVQLGVKYRAQHWSPLAGQEQYTTYPDASTAYVGFSSHHGYTVEPREPFKP